MGEDPKRRTFFCAMASELQQNLGGFNFENCRRNAFMEENGMKMPTFRKTGTTIVGCVYKDGVVLGADTRATGDTTAADTEQTTGMVESQLELHRMSTGRQSRVATALA